MCLPMTRHVLSKVEGLRLQNRVCDRWAHFPSTLDALETHLQVVWDVHDFVVPSAQREVGSLETPHWIAFREAMDGTTCQPDLEGQWETASQSAPVRGQGFVLAMPKECAGPVER